MALSRATSTLLASLSCSTANGAQHTHVLIKETDASATLRKVRLIAPSGDWIAFNPDKGRGRAGQMSALLATGPAHDHHRACDCVVVVNRGDHLTVLYVDLKSGNPKGYAGQFKSTKQFVRYVLGLADEFHGLKWSKVDERYVVLFGGRPSPLNKRTTVPRARTLGPSRPDRAAKREVHDGAALFLKELLV
jgi:hypothetical protein